MKFAELYRANRDTVERAIRAMWCGETGNESQKAYATQLREVIKNIFAPKDAVPVVQCMNSYEPVHSANVEEAKAVVGGLWKKPFAPYEHQYLSWNTLLNKQYNGKPMSICVTTGTGSGKTECFMMPLVYDLTKAMMQDQVQALFLYPLNALMEDQKERLEELLEGTNLTYTVYNGDLPEDEPNDDDQSKEAERQRNRIRQIRGYNKKTGEYIFKRMIYTRKMVRKNPPNILLTNPTMLEYILLRGKDATLTVPTLKSLRWIVIDETHTYTGAGAAEIAMLLRRVLLAFGVKAGDVRFATSSATFGNGSNPEKEKVQLQEFISGITGVSPKQVEVIGGKRIGEDSIPHNEDENRWKVIFHDDFVPLDKLFPEGTIEEKLVQLDAMCERVPKDASGMPAMKAKAHFFYRVPNNGLYVRLTEHEDGAFKIYSQATLNEEDETNPLLELSRCKHCGEYVALARYEASGPNFGTYHPLERRDSDMFDIEEMESMSDEESDMKFAIIGLSNKANEKGDNNVQFNLIDGKLMPMGAGETTSGWHLVANTQFCCPYCNSKLSNKHDSDEEVDDEVAGNMQTAYLQKFRLSADFISRVIAPSILDCLEKGDSNDPDKIVLHDGQQYISFADSRQMAAKATMNQNLEQERLWFYSIVYRELCRRKAKEASIRDRMKQLKGVMLDDDDDDTAILEYKKLQKSLRGYMDWKEIAQVVKNDKYCPVFCDQFVKRTMDSDELDEEGNIRNSVMEKYVQSIMVMYLANQLTSRPSPETMGLFHSHYPQLKKVELPEAVDKYNNLMQKEENKIKKDDWHHLLQIFMDYTVRSNQSVFLKLSEDNPIDIFACERFAIEKPRRRPVTKPKMERGKLTQSRVVRYLCALVVRNNPSLKQKDVYNIHFDILSDVVDALWADVNRDGGKLLEKGQHWNADENTFDYDSVKSRDGKKLNTIRFNLANLCFKLYDEAYLCDVNTDASVRHVACLRPIENNFKGFSPFLRGTTPVDLKENQYEQWKPYPYTDSEERIDKEVVERWAKENRSLLWNNGIWGEDGVFSNRLTDIYAIPNLFIQAEHTAQVDKAVSRTLQSEFKDHTINILACSTTMEMGVDLGSLELVLLSSMPPMPANYKQRAGRCGRNNKVTSACITLCGSDAIGLRTLYNPIETIISRPIKVPMVDLMSPQVIQRHVNSYLIRTFGVFTDGNNGGKITQKVVDYYTPYVLRTSGGHLEVVDPLDNTTKDPSDLLGKEDGTMYATFNQKCTQALSDNVIEEMKSLLSDTVFDGHISYVVAKAKSENERLYSELSKKLDDYGLAFTGATNERFRTRVKLQYLEVMNQRLLNFWATSRFTPNANMPVNVLTLDLNTSGKKDFFTPSTSSNPSYGLREAIAQYAPGNNIIVDGVAYIVRGIEFTDMYQGVKSFKQIYRNDERCVVNDSTLDSKRKWDVNDGYGLELIEPVGFIPDMNEERSRIMDVNAFTRVSAQLIGTEDWKNIVTEPHLFSVRSNRDSGDAKILYYNEGVGYGYCFCSRCGRMVLETNVADPNDRLAEMPWEMNMLRSKTEGKPNYHFAISGKDFHKGCGGSNDPSVVKRNVIIGGLVQTDYVEIRIRHKGDKSWIPYRTKENEKLLFTLGIVFTQSLLDILGKERGSIDFTIMPNGHICLFDTNPGGAGYANQLASVALMKDVITAAKLTLTNAKEHGSKDMLLNKQTLRFIKYIDIDKALEWIAEEEESRDILPAEVADVSPSASEVTLVEMEKAFRASSKESVFFVSNNYRTWNYDDGEHGWRNHFLDHFQMHQKMTTLCVAKNGNERIPEPAMEMLRDVKSGWAKEIVGMENPYMGTGVYPIAYIEDALYFVNNKEFADLNDQWGNGTMYCARVANIVKKAQPIDCKYKDSTRVFKLEGDDAVKIMSNELGAIIQSHSASIVEQFIAHCKASSSNLVIKYQDEHLKSVMGMVITLQTIAHFVRLTGKDAFTLEFLLEKYENNMRRQSVTANLSDSHQRDQKLSELVEGWLNGLDADERIQGELIPVDSKERNTLTHWRVLSIQCGNKCLEIYPDGGFANGWNLNKDRSVNPKLFTIDGTDTNDHIGLFRSRDIKFDVTVEDA